jgi:general secretion pathway protein K
LAVLLFLAVMLAAAMGVNFLAQVQLRSAYYLEEKEQAYYLARAGLARGIEDVSRYWAGRVPWLVKADGEWVYWTPERNARFSVQNEQGKLNLSRLRPSIMLSALTAGGLPPDEARELRDALLDWMDSNDLRRTNGAERDYYLSLPQPYEPRNGTIQCPGEFLSIRGITPGMLFGLSPDDKPVNPRLPRGLWGLFSIYTRSSRLDVNSASRPALLALPGMEESLVGRLIDRRDRSRFNRLSQVRQVLGDSAYRLAAPLLTVMPSRVYTIISEAWLPGRRAGHSMLCVVRFRGSETVDYLYWVDDLFYAWPR